MREPIYVLVMSLCMSLATMPANAADIYTLGIFGNANMDDLIDEDDIAYIEGIIEGTNDVTELADANYDGEIDENDITQIELIISGNEKELTLLDGKGVAVTVHKPVERIIVESDDNAEMIRILNAKDRIVAVGSPSEIYFPELSKLPSIGSAFDPDYEAILSFNPDLLLTFGYDTPPITEKQEKLPGVAVVFLGIYYPGLSNPEESQYIDGVRKLGYILDREDEAEKYIKWRTGWMNEIKSRTETISEDERPRVLMCNRPDAETNTFRTYAKVDTLAQMVLFARGRSIVEDLPEFAQSLYKIEVDSEWVIVQNPDFIFVHNAAYAPVQGYEADDPTGMGDPSGMKTLRDGLINRPELANVTAVKTGDIYIMSGIFRNDATGGLVGAAYMARLLYPDIFEDLDPEAIHREYLDLQHVDYDLDEHGIFVYPPIITGEGKLAGIPDRYYDSIIAQT